LFKSLTDCGKYYCVSARTIMRCCQNYYQNVKGQVFQYYDEWTKLSHEEQNKIKNRKAKNIKIIINVHTLETFESHKVTAAYYNIKVSSINACCLNKQPLVKNKYIFQYYDEWIKLSKEEQEQIKNRKSKANRYKNKENNDARI
jgi:hypothetical protein